MAKYVKSSAKIPINFINAANNEVLITITEKTHLDMGEIFTDKICGMIISQTIKSDKEPEDLIVMAVARFKKVKET